MDRAARVRELRGKYPDIRPFVDEIREARLAALREVLSFASGYAAVYAAEQIIKHINDLIKREEEGR